MGTINHIFKSELYAHFFVHTHTLTPTAQRTDSLPYCLQIRVETFTRTEVIQIRMKDIQEEYGIEIIHDDVISLSFFVYPCMRNTKIEATE